MKYPLIEVEHGKRRIIKGYFVQNAGKNNGLIVRRNQEPHKGKPVDNLEIWEVFLTKPRGDKPSRWMVQFNNNSEYASSYGYPKWVKYPPATLFNLIECLKQVYEGIYGEKMDEEDVLSDTVTVPQDGPREERPKPVKPGNKKTLERLREYGF
jgi:hypothetical protein